MHRDKNVEIERRKKEELEKEKKLKKSRHKARNNKRRRKEITNKGRENEWGVTERKGKKTEKKYNVENRDKNNKKKMEMM